MKHHHLMKFVVALVALVLLSSCGGNSASGSNSAYRLFPVSIKTEPAGNGFVNYTVQMGIENTGNQIISTGVLLGDVNLRTSEGSSYHFGQPAQTNRYFSVWGTCSLPPSIKVTTSQEDGAYTFQVGETLHPKTLDFSEYGSVSLNSTNSTFPTDKPDSAFLDFPQTVQDGDITLKILEPRLSNESTFTSPWQVGIDVEVYNANSAKSGYAVLGLEIYDRFGQCHSNQQFASISDVGPLQTKQGTIWMEPDVSFDESRENVKDILRGAKIYISYNNGVYDGVFNLRIP